MDMLSLLIISPLLIIAVAIVLTLFLVAWRRSQYLISVFSFFCFTLALLANITVNIEAATPVTALFLIHGYSQYAFGLILLLAMFITCLSAFYFEETNRFQAQVVDEYYILLQLVLLGAGVLIYSQHFASLFLGFELMSIALVGLIAYLNKNSFSVESGFKYLILSASASCFMLLGIAFIYSQAGTLSFTEAMLSSSQLGYFYHTGVMLFLVGIAFKLSLAPFHFWTPDVYQGAPTPVTLLLASVSKVAIYVVLLKVWFAPVFNNADFINVLVSALAIASMLVGNLLALKQDNIKRILAYSSIAHMGYLLLTLQLSQGERTDFAWQAGLFYLTGYVLANTAILTTLLLTQLNAYQKNNQASLEQVDTSINVWRGLFWQQPMLAILVTLSLLSLAGIPLTLGFMGKFYLLNLAVQAKLWWLLAVFVIASGIGLFYYLRMIFTLFHTEGEKSLALDLPRLSIKYLIVVVLLVLSSYLGIFPDVLAQALHQLTILN